MILRKGHSNEGSDQDSVLDEDDDGLNQDVDLSALDDEEPQDDDTTPKWLKPLSIVAVIIIIALVLAAIFMAVKNKPHKLTETSNNGVTSLGSAGHGSTENVNNVNSFMNDLGIPKYYQQPYTKISKTDKATADQLAMATRPPSAYGTLVSKASNPKLTDDVSKWKNDDGTLNPDYSYITAENVIPLIRDDLERLVNPVYGGWTALQDAGRVNVDGKQDNSSWGKFADMFASDVARGMSDEAGVRKVAPVFADWDRNQYGKSFAKKYSDPIVGTISNLNCDYQIGGAYEDHVDCTAHVKYTGKAVVAIDGVKGDNPSIKYEDKTVEKDIKLHYAVNYTDRQYSDRRLLLTSVEQ